MTKRNQFLLLLINTLIDRLRGIKYFYKLDLRDVYYLIRIREGDERKTVFYTIKKYYEYFVILFDLINISAIFQLFINLVFA